MSDAELELKLLQSETLELMSQSKPLEDNVHKLSFPFFLCSFLILAACSNKVEKDKRKLLSVLHSAYFSAQASYMELGYFPPQLKGLKKKNEECSCFISYYSFKERFFIKVEKGDLVYTITEQKVILDKNSQVVALSEIPQTK